MPHIMAARFIQGAAGILLTLSVVGVITDEMISSPRPWAGLTVTGTWGE